MQDSWAEVTLSNGKVASVRRLGLFELDSVDKNIPGPYTYTLKLGSDKEFEIPFDFSVERIKPETPLEEVEEGTQLYYEWQEYLRYQEALNHSSKQLEAYAEYCERVFGYICENCIRDVEIGELTDEDWAEIYHLTLNPLVSIEEITAAMRNSFQS
jgi:hypothetical protein